jgi:hypothetical protein
MWGKRVKLLTPVLAFILCITSGSHHLFGIDVNLEKEINISTTFKMIVLHDGLPCGDSVFVSLKIYSNHDKIYVKWTHAYYKSFEGSGTGVRIQHFATGNDTITDLEVSENSFYFTLHYDTESPLKIVGIKKKGDYHVEGIGLWWDGILKREVNIKWYSISTIPYYHTNGEAILL